MGRVLLTSTGDIIGWWKEYFEEFVKPVVMPSTEEVEAGDSEEDSAITQIKVTEVVFALVAGHRGG